jgi:hypothetical protein
MASLLSDTALPVTLSEQLDAMLCGWLDRHAPDGDLGDADQPAAGVVTVANAHVAEVEPRAGRVVGSCAVNDPERQP